jgi:membrane-bound lytic murein transglycosylase MltF
VCGYDNVIDLDVPSGKGDFEEGFMVGAKEPKYSCPMCALNAVAVLILLLTTACSNNETNAGVEVQQPAPDPTAVQAVTEEPLPDELDEFDEVLERWTGDFDGMVERRLIRALVVYSKTFYFLDGGEQKGATYQALKLFEERINKDLGTGHLKVHVLIVPVRRDRLLPALVEGRGDIAASNLTVTEERRKLVDFSDPVVTGVSEIVVTGPGVPAPLSLEDLSGKEIVVRPSSSYHESLRLLNAILARRSIAPIQLTPAEEYLEDEDLLEMVNAGLIPRVVVDSHKAEFWAQIFENIAVHPEVAVATSGEIAWAFRKRSPKLAAVVNAFVKENKVGTLMGNIIVNRYFRDAGYVEKSLSNEGMEKFRTTLEFFQKYAAMYDFDWLMLAALGYQESRLDQSLRSRAGAIGVMQLLPSTAADKNVGIPNIENLESNIHAGTKYLRFIRDRYFENEDMTDVEKTLFTFASYNAGPARIAALRGKALAMGFDPNLWFQNVEVVAAKEIGRETVQYVSNIAKYYVAYKRLSAELRRKGQLPGS